MPRLFCENEFCIYQKDGSFVLESIQLDNGGSCIECIHINIEEDCLKSLKEKLLTDLA